MAGGIRPQVGGLLSGARSPPSSFTRTRSNGTCGASRTSAVSRPVTGVGDDVPDQPHRESTRRRLRGKEDPVHVAGERSRLICSPR